MKHPKLTYDETKIQKREKNLKYENDEFADEMTYVWAGESRFIIDHTEVKGNFTGRRLGKQLVMKAVEYARNNGLKILPLYPFAKKVFDKDVGLKDVRV